MKYWCIVFLIILVLPGCSFPMSQVLGQDNGFRVQRGSFQTSVDAGIADVAVGSDADGDGIDDALDLVGSAQAYLKTDPHYDGSYHEGGYPPEGIGVCTDLIWAAFQGAGYDLKALIDADIAENPAVYGIVRPDPNIDFRRVPTQEIYFKRHAETLPTELNDPAQWMPGDIVVYNHDKHIALCSDKRNADGYPWILHNAGQHNLEEDRLKWANITGHYRMMKRNW